MQNGAPYLLATQTSALASVFIYDSGLEALPIGGFTGTIPSPTLAQLQTDIREGKFHWCSAAASQDPRLHWIAVALPQGGQGRVGTPQLLLHAGRRRLIRPTDAGDHEPGAVHQHLAVDLFGQFGPER